MDETAATTWIKWNPESPLGPILGEWCLWSMVWGGERNYFSGCLLEIEGKLFLKWEGFSSIAPDDSVWWARVNKLPQYQIEGRY